METPTYRIERAQLLNQFEQQFGYHFSDGYALVKAQYRRQNNMHDNHCYLDDVTLEKEVNSFYVDLSMFGGCKELLANIKDNDNGFNQTISDVISTRCIKQELTGEQLDYEQGV